MRQKTFLSLVFSALLVCSLSVNAVIRECSHLREILEFVDEDTLVVLDLDNTLIEPVQVLGSDQWVDAILDQMLADGYTIDEALEELLPLWRRIVARTEVRLVEEDGAGVLAHLQGRGIPCIALTTRCSATADSTARQLASLDIDFTRTSPAPSQFKMPVDRGFYRDGVLLCSGANKGRILSSFFGELGFIPKKVLFVDDKSSNVMKVGEAMDLLGVEYLGFRFSGADERVEKFDEALAHVQLRAFEMLMSDELAEALLEGKYEEAWHLFIEHFDPHR